jgi:hypothetical protein
MNPDIERMRNWLNANPTDWPVRLILADLYEEIGEKWKAQCMRWMGTNQKCPESMYFGPRISWFWDTEGLEKDKSGTHILPHRLYWYLSGPPESRSCYPSAREAEDDLMKSWAYIGGTW